ncbi:MAG: DUF6146 family protein [Bacteroidales bacterium]
MKTILKISALALLSVLMFSCVTQREINDSRAGRLGIRDTTSVKDSTEYELIVFDPGFDYWLNSHNFSKNQYSNSYLQSLNNQYVQEWNRRYSTGDRRIESYIDYNVSTNYDFEFNYKLFMYFKYFEQTYRTKLRP